MANIDFKLFFKALNVTKDTCYAIAKEFDTEISRLTIQKLPYTKGRERSSVLKQIQLLKQERERIVKKYGKDPVQFPKEYPTITPVASDNKLNTEGQD
jgi:hypothetical protein